MPDVSVTFDFSREMAAAPVDKKCLVFGNGGWRFAIKDQHGQWRNMMGRPNEAPTAWAVLPSSKGL